MIAIDLPAAGNLPAADVLHVLEFTPACRSRRHSRPAVFYVDAHGCLEGLACAECVTDWFNDVARKVADGLPVYCVDCLRPFHHPADFYSRVVAL